MATGKLPNPTLRELRCALHLTQAGLAERLCTELAKAGINGSPDARLVAAWESGEIQRPQRHYRDALRAVLGVRDDSHLGFVSRAAPRRSPRVLVSVVDLESEDQMRRQEFLRGIAVVAFNCAVGQPLQPWLGVDRSRSVRASRVGMSDVEGIERTTAQFASWDMTRGGMLSADAVLGQLNWSATLLDQATFASDQVRRRMCAAVAYLARIAGMSAYDAGLHADARRALALGVHAAAEAGDWPLRAFILAGLSRQSITLGQPREALDLMSVAHYGARDTATAPTLAMLHVVSARAHAVAGQVQNALREIGTAEDVYGPPSPDDPAWIGYYIPAQLAGDSGVASFDAAQHDPALRGQALDRLTRAADSYGPSYPRSTAFCLARLAAIHLDTGEPDAAVHHGDQFLESAQGIASARVSEDYRMLATHTRPHLRIPAIADLDHRLALTSGRTP